MAAINIKAAGSTRPKFASEIDESMEMSAAISVILSRNDALCSKAREVCSNGPRIKVAALCVSDKEVAGIEAKSRHEPKVSWWKVILYTRTQGTPVSYIDGLPATENAESITPHVSRERNRLQLLVPL
jgi:hypothetical protein